jgi:hypothetical protein
MEENGKGNFTWFEDDQKRRWDIPVNVNKIAQVNRSCDVLLTKVVDDNMKLLARILEDPVLFVDILYVLCREQCQQREMEFDTFAEMFMGDLLEKASDAFMESLVNFFQRPKQRASLRKVLRDMKEAQGIYEDEMAEAVNKINIQSMVKNAMKQSGKLLESSVSTPTP